MGKVTLRSITTADSKVIFSVINQNRSYLRRWLTFIDDTINEDFTLSYILKTSSYKKGGDIVFVIENDGLPVGLIGYESINNYRKKAELGYWIFPAYENKGFMNQAVSLALKIGFCELSYNRIEIKSATGNIKSWILAEKHGFFFEGIERDGELLSTKEYTDVKVYSLLKREFIKSI